MGSEWDKPFLAWAPARTPKATKDKGMTLLGGFFWRGFESQDDAVLFKMKEDYVGIIDNTDGALGTLLRDVQGAQDEYFIALQGAKAASSALKERMKRYR